MMHKAIVLTCTFFLTSLLSHARLIVIRNNDGYTNLRSQPGKQGRIIDRIPDGSICMLQETAEPDSPSSAGWHRASRGNHYPATDTIWRHLPDPPEGYIHQSQYAMLDTLQALKSSLTQDSCLFENDTWRVVIIRRPFQAGAHRVTSTNGMATAIDGRHIWGMDGGIPATEISSITLYKAGQQRALPASAFRSVYQPDFDRAAVYATAAGTVYIVMAGGDGAGTYYAVWTWKDNSLVSTNVFGAP